MSPRLLSCWSPCSYADSDVTLVAIAREEFESLLGHLRDLLERNLGMRLLLCIPIVSLLSNEEVRGSMMLDFVSHITLSRCNLPQHRPGSRALRWGQ